VQGGHVSLSYWSREFQYIQREKQMSYGVAITVKYNETTSTGIVSSEREYFFHVDTASKAIDLVSETASNCNRMGATIEKVSITDESRVAA
jgi:RNase P/RNase MRP subunit POP5